MSEELTEEVEKVNAQHVWFISDTHFGHENIIKYCNRPYASAKEMDKDMVAKWNAKVKKNDIVWHLGDFSLGNKKDIEKVFKQLHGNKRIVLGNHDSHSMKFYYDIGFSKVYDRPVLFNGFFILSHAPLGWVNNDLPFANVFGHVHNSELYNTFTARSACVCVERWNYAPLLWSDILTGMQKEEQKISIKENK